MDYQVAKNIRGRSLSSLITNKITSGSSVSSAIGRTVTEKMRAAGTGIIQKFDPLNIAKFVTGGSKLAPAVLGRITGRSQADINFFAGTERAKTERQKRRYTTISEPMTTSENLGSSSIEVLNDILSFLKKSNEQDRLRRETEKTFYEEKQVEDARRHREFVEVLKQYTQLSPVLPTPAKPEERQDPTAGILSTVKKMIAEVVENFKRLMVGMLSLVGDMIKAAVIGIKKLFEWLNPLKKLLTAKNLIRLLTFLGRFAGPVALAYGLWKLVSYAAEKLPNLKALSPEEALNVLENGSPKQMMDETGAQDVDQARQILIDTATQGKQKAQQLLKEVEESPTDELSPDLEKRIRDMGGLSKVQRIAEAPDLDQSKLLGALKRNPFSDSFMTERITPYEEYVSRGATDVDRQRLANRWWNNFGKRWDPATGLRLDLLENQGPFVNTYGVPGFESAGDVPDSTIKASPEETVTPLSDQTIKLNELKLNMRTPNITPYVNSEVKNLKAPNRPMSATATTRDNTLIFQMTIQRNQAPL
jgi:hypothetical protein